MNTEEKRITNRREFIECLYDVRKVIRWAFKITNTDQTVAFFKKKLKSMIILTALGLLQPAAMSFIFTGLIREDTRMVAGALGALFMLLIIQRWYIHSLWKYHEYLFGPALENINCYITDRFFEKSPGQHKSLKGLNHESVAKGKGHLFSLYLDIIPQVIETGSLIIIAYVFIWFLSPVSGAIATALILLHVGWSLFLNYRAAKECPIIEEEFSAFERYMVSRWRYVQRVIVSAKEGDELIEIKNKWVSVIDKDRRFWLWHLNHTSVRGIADVVAFIGIVSWGAYLVAKGRVESVGFLYPMFAWASVIKDNIWRFTQLQRMVTGMVPSLKVMMDTIEVKPDITDSESAVPLNSSDPLLLEFENITFGYQLVSAGNQKPTGHTIRGVSFILPKGKRIALVGPSGSGKSTIHYLALRFMNQADGVIRANGKDIRDYTLSSWRRAVAYIPQHAQIFDGTVRDNLLYALSHEEKTEWTDLRLLELLLVLAIDFGSRPKDENPLNIIVGRDGVQLSGGQAQRLVIGAAVVKKPRLLLIDEATSHLDSTTERAVLEGLEKLVSGVTTLVIAHRLSTVRSADGIIVLNDGVVEATAPSFEVLFELSPTFRRLATDQNIAM